VKNSWLVRKIKRSRVAAHSSANGTRLLRSDNVKTAMPIHHQDRALIRNASDLKFRTVAQVAWPPVYDVRCATRYYALWRTVDVGGRVSAQVDARAEWMRVARSRSRFLSRSITYARENLRPSTVNGYTKLWDVLCPRVGEIRLRDFKTVDAANLLTALAAKGLGRRSLQHAKSLLSGIFTYAKNLGVLDGINPVQGTLIPRKAAAPGETHATTPEEAIEILELLGRAKN